MSPVNHDQTLAEEILQGGIDTHIHGYPDVVRRKMNDLELARQAKKAKMGGIIIKCHLASTEGRAYLARQAVPGINVWGGIALNWNTGGINPDAVQLAAKMGAKIVWMPTVSAENHIRMVGATGHMNAIGGGIHGTGLKILDASGNIKKQVMEVLEVVKSMNMILATGHISPLESVYLIHKALDMRIKKILFTHPEGYMTRLDLEEQKSLAKKGVFFERCWAFTTNVVGEENRIEPEEIPHAIHTVGPESTIMASDHGQANNPPPVTAMKHYITAMLANEILPKDIEIMIRSNPLHLLDN